MKSLMHPKSKLFVFALKRVNLLLLFFLPYLVRLASIIGSLDEERFETVHSFCSIGTPRCSV